MTATNPPFSSTGPQEWDRLRAAFATSLMLDTPLASLAQNLDGLAWPVDDEDETPAAYVDLSYDELVGLFAARQRPDSVALLCRILRETLDYDRSFGDLAKLADASADLDNPLRRTLARLNIPEEFPLALTMLDAASRELCRLEHIRTLGHFALFAQDLAQRIVVGGDFRRFLNALAHRDEATLAEFLPFRPGASGVHLVEALGQAARAADAPEQVAHVLAWFTPEFCEWKREAAANRRFVPRQLSLLGDEVLERRILDLLAPHLGPVLAAAPRGLVGRLRHWLGL